MPIFLVADGTTATNAATSYVSVLEADEYLSLSREYNAAWTALAVADKETHLMHASRLLDQAVNYTGLIYSADTNLRWPRKLAFDCDGLSYEVTEIPGPIKDATIELAGYYATHADINATDVMTEEEGLKSIKVATITLTWKDSAMSAATVNKFPQYISSILKCLGTVSFNYAGSVQGIKFKQGKL